MDDKDIIDLINDCVGGMETRFETRFDKLEGKLDRWMEKKTEKNGEQELSIQENAARIEAIEARYKRTMRRVILIATAVVAPGSAVGLREIAKIVAELLASGTVG